MPFPATARDATLESLLYLARTIWGPEPLSLIEIVVRAQVTLGDLARQARDGGGSTAEVHAKHRYEVQKEIGNLIFSCIRWADDLGFDPFACVQVAAQAQERFASSGRKR